MEKKGEERSRVEPQSRKEQPPSSLETNTLTRHPKHQQQEVILPSSTVSTDDTYSSSSSVSYSRRQLNEEVELIGTSDCRLTTSLETSTTYHHGGGDDETMAAGIMFTIQSKEFDVEILTLEFDTTTFLEVVDGDGSTTSDYEYPSSSTSSEIPVEVYYKTGDFVTDDGAINDDATKWIQVSQTSAIISPDLQSAIIPVQDFTPVTVFANSLISIYITTEVLQTTSDDNPKIKFKSSTQSLIGSTSREDTTMVVNYGAAFHDEDYDNDDGSFPNSPSSQVVVAEFLGTIHYRTLQECSNVVTTTQVILELAIDGDPTEMILTAINNAVEDSIQALLILNSNLATYTKFFFLNMVHVNTGFMGRDPGTCMTKKY